MRLDVFGFIYIFQGLAFIKTEELNVVQGSMNFFLLVVCCPQCGLNA